MADGGGGGAGRGGVLSDASSGAGHDAGVTDVRLGPLTLFIRSLLGRRTALLKVVGNVGWLFADRALRLGVGLVVGVWTARYLGPEQFGLLSYASVVLALFSFLTTLGLDNIVISHLVRDPARRHETLGSAFALKLVGGGLTAILALGAVHILRPADSLSHGLVAILAPCTFFQAFDAIDIWFQSQVESKYSVIAKNAAFVVTAFVRVLLMVFRAPLQALAAVVLLESVLGALGLVALYHFRGQTLLSWRVSTARARYLLANSWPLMLSGAAIMVYMKIDVIMLQALVNDEAVGVYSAATRISELWYFVPVIVVSSVFPALVNLKRTNEPQYYLRLQELFSFLAGLGFVTALMITLLSPAVVSLLYGSSYTGAAAILAIHIWAVPFVFLGVAQSPWDIAEGLTRLALQRTILGAIVNVILNALLLPRYAGLGAAIATVVAYACAACLGNVLNTQTRRILWLQLEALFLVRFWRQVKGRL